MANESNNDIQEGDVVVFTVINNVYNLFDGAHAMAAVYTDGQYRVYNAYLDSKDYSELNSLYNVNDHSGWIYGFRIW